MADADQVARAVLGALARHAGWTGDAGLDRPLESLAVDSLAMMRVLLEVEAELGLDPLELDDGAFATPRHLVAAVAVRVPGR